MIWEFKLVHYLLPITFHSIIILNFHFLLCMTHHYKLRGSILIEHPVEIVNIINKQ